MSLRTKTESGFLSLRDELQEINECLNTLDENYKSPKSVPEEIDEIRNRVMEIERHLGIREKIAGRSSSRRRLCAFHASCREWRRK